MGVLATLSEIMEAIEFQTGESTAYLNKETGEIITISEEEFQAAEDEDSPENYPEWQQDNVKTAMQILDNEENFLTLPTKHDINEYLIMETFCLSIKNKLISEALSDAIKGNGAFPRFKDNVQRFKIADKWYRFREEAIKQIAIEWCRSKHIEYVDK
jgi:alpha-acetolactate decarboxylase